MKSQILVVVAFTALIMSCGGSDFSESTIDQPDVTTDSGLPDSNVPDTNVPDADTTTDVGPDTTVDASPDVIIDAAPDTTTPVDSGNQCTAGAVDCQGKTPRSCDQNGVWQTKTDCQFLCVNAVCKGSCTPGTKQCKDTELQFCDANGAWQHSESCAMSCDKNANPPACMGNWCCSSNTMPTTNWTAACECHGIAGSCAANWTSSCTASNYDCCYTETGVTKSCQCYKAKSQDACTKIIADAKEAGVSTHYIIESVTSCPAQ
jgi:hypothetical protein